MYVMLISSEGEKFFLKREYALLSPTIEAMLTGPEHDEKTHINKVTFLGIR